MTGELKVNDIERALELAGGHQLRPLGSSSGRSGQCAHAPLSLMMQTVKRWPPRIRSYSLAAAAAALHLAI
jgi:hypothetical protein